MAPSNCVDGFPSGVKTLLNAHQRFEGITGLIRVMTESDGTGRFSAGWILARAPSGLVSIVVRETSRVTAGELAADVNFAVEQAKRYCASSAVVVEQELRTSYTGQQGDVSEKAFGISNAKPDLLYAVSAVSAVPVWFAGLSPRNP
ncbi:hypothetical protein OKW43_005770 [Paraburkholderia sp. WC7.3g]|uniref:Uncharacterized protein n=1 Tax=Paraburkholderia podalyriae TaxID=1938811 RepID=A0ABR7Q125_9BURK|nr:hypothetical protein [Paraburkholderia podalyriae]MBC8752250.1 hypothetical protein [Paraburkholderia podalyriae]